MEISPLAFRSPDASERAAARPEPIRAVDGAAPVPATPPVAGTGVSVVTGVHEGTGALTTTLVDADSGEVIAQLPPEQVLDLVAHLIDLNRQRSEERNDHGEH